MAGAYRFWLSRFKHPLPGLKAPVRVVQLSDLHFGPWVHEDSVRLWAEAAMAENPDLIVITGDIVDGSSRIPWRSQIKEALAQDYSRLLEAIKGLRAPLGVYAVWGNHDYYNLPAKEFLTTQLPKLGIKLLVNQGVRLRPDFYLAGLDDFWEGHPNAPEALQDCPKDIASLMLCHNPDYLEDIPKWVSLTLCGHTHGGQVKLPLIGAPWTPSWFGDKYASGWFEDVIPMFVSRGLGVTTVPMRLGAPAEVVVFDFLPPG